MRFAAIVLNFDGGFMTLDRIKLCAVAAALATSLTGEVFAQSTGAAPAPAGAPALTQGTGAADSSRARTDPTRTQTPSPTSTQPAAAKGLANGAASQAPLDAATRGSGITGGVPALNGVTPNRAELPASAFTKLDGANRGYLTIEDVRQLDGFESAFRQADQNGDGRLNASEFNTAWGAFTGNAR